MGESGKRGNLADAIELSSSHCLKSTFLIKAIYLLYTPLPKIAKSGNQVRPVQQNLGGKKVAIVNQCQRILSAVTHQSRVRLHRHHVVEI